MFRNIISLNGTRRRLWASDGSWILVHQSRVVQRQTQLLRLKESAVNGMTPGHFPWACECAVFLHQCGVCSGRLSIQLSNFIQVQSLSRLQGLENASNPVEVLAKQCGFSSLEFWTKTIGMWLNTWGIPNYVTKLHTLIINSYDTLKTWYQRRRLHRKKWDGNTIRYAKQEKGSWVLWPISWNSIGFHPTPPLSDCFLFTRSRVRVLV